MGTHHGGLDPTDAHLALDDVANARNRLADHVGLPRWYGVGLGLSLATAFLALGASGAVAVAGVALFAVLVPLALFRMVRRSTGVHQDRYLGTPGFLLVPGLALLGVLAVALRWTVGLHWGTVPSAVAALVLVLLLEPRIDAEAQRGLRRAP